MSMNLLTALDRQARGELIDHNGMFTLETENLIRVAPFKCEYLCCSKTQFDLM